MLMKSRTTEFPSTRKSVCHRCPADKPADCLVWICAVSRGDTGPCSLPRRRFDLAGDHCCNNRARRCARSAHEGSINSRISPWNKALQNLQSPGVNEKAYHDVPASPEGIAKAEEPRCRSIGDHMFDWTGQPGSSFDVMRNQRQERDQRNTEPRQRINGRNEATHHRICHLMFEPTGRR